ncbi:MAG: hypothetical protein WKG07_20005 [Hymenobacter sp.]
MPPRASAAPPPTCWPLPARCCTEEAAALHDVADAVAATPDFARCVAAILGLAGRVVVTGIGKSAHIARQNGGHAQQHRHAGPVHARRRCHPRRPGHDSGPATLWWPSAKAATRPKSRCWCRCCAARACRWPRW